MGWLKYILSLFKKKPDSQIWAMYYTMSDEELRQAFNVLCTIGPRISEDDLRICTFVMAMRWQKGMSK